MKPLSYRLVASRTNLSCPTNKTFAAALSALASILLLSQPARAAIYFTEGFNYSTGNLTAWASPGAGIQVTTPGMTLGSLTDTSPTGNKISVTPGASRTQSANFIASPGVSSGTVYFSFLLNCTTAPTADTYLIGLVSDTKTLSGSADPMLLYFKPSTTTTGDYNLRIRHSGQSESTAATNDLAPNSTNFIVMKYTFSGVTGGDTVALFVNPTPGGTEPATPDAAPTGGTPTNAPNLAVVSVKAQTATTSGNWDIDTIRVGSTWADVTPATGACLPPTVGQNPVSQTNFAGLTVSFSIAAGGSSPTYQWQVSTNSGGSWNNIANATNNNYITPALALADNGSQFRCVVSVACGGGSSVNSTAATVTVLPAPVFTGVIVSNVWASGTFTNPPPPVYSDSGVVGAFGDIESSWFAIGSTSATGLTNQNPNSMTFIAQTNSRTWLTHFTSNGVVHLNNGELIKVTTVFTPTGVVDNTNANFALGIFNYLAPGATRLTGNIASSSTGGNNVQGYICNINFSSTFHTNNPNPTPLDIRVRTNLPSANLMGTSGDYSGFSSGGATEGAPGFVDGSTYTNILSVTRSNNIVLVGCQFTGPAGFNVSYTANDKLGTNNVDFDTFAIRPANNSTTASNFLVTLFKVEKAVLTVPVTLVPSHINTIQRYIAQNQTYIGFTTTNGNNYQLLYRTNVAQAPWITNAAAGIVAGDNSNKAFYDTTTDTNRFYRVQSF